jgi:hypothetical protein
MHLTDGELRAYQDQELNEPERARAQLHLSACDLCQDRAEDMASHAGQVEASLASLAPLPHEAPGSIETARARFQARRIEKENLTMFQKIFTRAYRPAWAALAVIVILAAALAIPSVRAVANSFLGLFRIQSVSIVQVDPGDLPDQLGSSEQFQQLISDDVKIEELGEPQEAGSPEEASSLAGIPVRLPAEIEGTPKLHVQPGTRAAFEIDLPRVRALMSEIGQEDIELPDELDGATVTLELPTVVGATYGDCEVEREGDQDPDEPGYQTRNCATLIQMASPEISAPPGLDVAGLGQAFLQLLGMSPEEAAQFSQTVDWTTTLVIPIPRYGMTYQDVPVDGVNGTLIWEGQPGAMTHYMLIWVKDGVVYSLSGRGNRSEALSIANSLK